MSKHELANPELTGFEVHGITRGSFILRGALAAGGGLRDIGGRALRLSGARRNGRGRRRNPQLRAHARVPRGELLRGQGQAGRPQRSGEGIRHCVRRRGGTATSRRSPPRSSSSAATPGEETDFVFPTASQGSFLALGLGAREHRRWRLPTGPAPSLQSKQVLRRGRRHRAGRGASRPLRSTCLIGKSPTAETRASTGR